MNQPITAEYVLGYFPELHELVTRRPGSWTFRATFDGDGGLKSVVLNRLAGDYTDTFFVVDKHIVAMRILTDDEHGGCVWSKQGADMKKIAAELVALPEPGEPGAPTEVLKTDLLWSPE
jgi:hypothetical protein